MAWIYLAALEESPWPWHHGCGLLPTVKETDMPCPFSYPECQMDRCPSLQYGMTCEHSKEVIFRWALESTSSTEDSHARTSVLLELERAYQDHAAACSTRSFVFAKKLDLDSYSLKMCLQSELEVPRLLQKNWPASGMILNGMLYQLLNSEPFIYAKDGSYLPTPTASDYGKNNGRNSPQAKDRWSLTVRARRGQLPYHVQGRLNPKWLETAMGYRSSWTEIEPWAIAWFRSKREKRSKGYRV